MYSGARRAVGFRLPIQDRFAGSQSHGLARRLLLRSDHTIADLHYAIQISMGWSDSHLHLFHIHGKDYGVAHAGGIFFSDDPKQIRLADFEFRLRERYLYEYDFYDHWEHDVRLEKVLPWSSRHILPACSGGHRLAPPEDCGGAQSYINRENDSRSCRARHKFESFSRLIKAEIRDDNGESPA